MSKRQLSKRRRGRPSRAKYRAKLKREADQLFARQVRDRGSCEARGLDDLGCAGVLQCAHIESRRFHALRWDHRNALCLCAAHHTYYTHRPFFWFMFIAEHFPAQHAHVTERLRDVWDKDLEAVLDRLKAEPCCTSPRCCSTRTP